MGDALIIQDLSIDEVDAVDGAGSWVESGLAVGGAGAAAGGFIGNLPGAAIGGIAGFAIGVAVHFL